MLFRLLAPDRASPSMHLIAQPGAKVTRDIDELRRALKEAIEREEFELAATLRDEINALSGGAF